MSYTLIFNIGSSSIKFKLFDEKFKEVFGGQAEKIGQKDPLFTFLGYRGGLILEDYDHEISLGFLLHMIGEKVDLKKITKVGHRVVHGGEEFVKPTLIDKKVLTRLTKYNKLAPLHNPYNLLGIKFCLKKMSWAKNYAVFDTAFYSSLPDYAYRYALPNKIYQKYGFRKFGFHGISHEYVASQAAKKLKKPLSKLNLITCHLGSGCSITAIKQGKAVDTSMGYTPLEGLMMLTRSGDLDPAIPLKMVERGIKVEEVEKMLNFESGIFGLTGFKDLRDVLTAAGYNVKNYKSSKKVSNEKKAMARMALNMFTYRVRKYIGAYTAVLGKVDAIVFTAGIGERSEIVRKLITKSLPFKIKTLVVPTNEELGIAKKI
jgi:acetate kinase